MTNKPTKRAIAIVGRPNVGKSSVFNRLGKRRAIVYHERGVTRDRMIQEVEWQGERFDLIDTGGLGHLDSEESRTNGVNLEDHIKRQIEIAVEESSAIIFVTDVEAGVIPQDEEVAEFLRKTGKPVFLAANKADNHERELNSVDFDKLSFPVYPISALHYRGFDRLMTDAVRELPPAEINCTIENPIRLAITGHPNVGKSSFINRLLGTDRVIVSDLPGTTRDSIDTPFVMRYGDEERHYILTDTAGIKSARKLRGAIEHFSLKSTKYSISKSDVAVLMLDAVQGPSTQDKQIAAMILEHQKGCVILVNKWDLRGDVKEKDYHDALRKAVPFLNFVPIVFVSAKTGFNIKRAIKTINDVADCNNASLGTGILNRTIQQAYEHKRSPMVGSKRMKIYYATQVGVHPITITLFVNSGGKMTSAYETFLANKLRRFFNLTGIPIIFKVKQKSSVHSSS